jgi:hypothetical protein
MLVPDVLRLKVLLIVFRIDLLEDILEAAVVFLQNGVLGAHVERQALEERHLEAGMGKARDGLVGVVLGLSDARAVEIEDVQPFRWCAILGREDQLEGSLSGDETVFGAVLIAKGVTSDDNWFGPSRD